MGPAWGPSCGGRIVWASLGNKEDPLRNPERNCPKAPHIVTTQALSLGSPAAVTQVSSTPALEAGQLCVRALGWVPEPHRVSRGCTAEPYPTTCGLSFFGVLAILPSESKAVQMDYLHAYLPTPPYPSAKLGGSNGGSFQFWG